MLRRVFFVDICGRGRGRGRGNEDSEGEQEGGERDPTATERYPSFPVFLAHICHALGAVEPCPTSMTRIDQENPTEQSVNRIYVLQHMQLMIVRVRHILHTMYRILFNSMRYLRKRKRRFFKNWGKNPQYSTILLKRINTNSGNDSFGRERGSGICKWSLFRENSLRRFRAVKRDIENFIRDRSPLIDGVGLCVVTIPAIWEAVKVKIAVGVVMLR